MENLLIVLEKIKSRKNGFSGNYYIPEVWNFCRYEKYTRDKGRSGEININPYEFMEFCLEKYIAGSGDKSRNYLMPLKNHKNNRKNICNSNIYSMLPRMYTAWSHYNDGRICGGTFLKAICLLPYLKKLGIDVIYLLPIFEYSSRYKKGGLGSPYAIKNVYRIDRNLHDELLGEANQAILEIEFKAFVEACHILGIRVLADFVFRTAARDSDLIIEHPDWFYWIDLECSNSFKTPSVENVELCTGLSDSTLKNLYESTNLKSYISMFSLSPDKVCPEKWEKVKIQNESDGGNILELIEREFGLTTVPAFPGVLNDPQPPWTDITFLRFYYDLSEKGRMFAGQSDVPYIMQDGVCLNLYPGSDVNLDLWEYVSGAIPYFQDNFGIDGARIDMGHVLPLELNREIIKKAREKNPEFILWSEEFSVLNSGMAKKDNFDFISGYVWYFYKYLEETSFNKQLFLDTLKKSQIPVAAAIETPDTPRAVFLHKDKKKLEQIILINIFLPNAIPFINSGFEVMEIQPMNLGLDNTEEGRFVLAPGDPMYGRLAFFDEYCLHWLSDDRLWAEQILSKAYALRSFFKAVVTKKENFLWHHGLRKKSKTTCICYCDMESGKNMFLIANRSFSYRRRIKPEDLIPEKLFQDFKSATLFFSSGDICNIRWELGMDYFLKPGEVIIGCFE
ncbi:MAG: alpha-amylase family glycosyl hydrolase [Clostridia bacterium]|nr:alpha-amylase family glycosyl hydrolase [Clostridia bacterium]